MRLSSVLIIVGFLSVALAIIIFVTTFYPVIMVELNYQLTQAQGELRVKKEIVPLDKDFGIVVPKISANAKVIPNIDPYNNEEYQVALTKGVAHALGTSFPGYAGNVFLFSHSSVNFYEANRYNSIFYLLDKLVVGDEIDLYYLNSKFKYVVTEKKVVNSSDVQYLAGDGTKKTVTLMTCWPPGTSWKRLLVIGTLAEN